MNRRLVTVEKNRISKIERKLRRIGGWMLLGGISWIIPITTGNMSERIVIENVHTGVREIPENIPSQQGMGTEDNGAGVKAEKGSDVIAKIAASLPEPAIALAIARAESGLNPKAASTTDKLADGRAFSHGLFQINLTVSTIAGVKCHEAFEGRNYKAKVKDEALFAKCVKLAQDVDHSIEVAKQKYEGRGNWTAWGAFTSDAYKRFL